MHTRKLPLVFALTAALAAGGTAAPAAAHPRHDPKPDLGSLQSLRGPVTDENFYFVMADRFANGSTDNDDGGLGPDPMVSGFDPTSKGFYNGGDLQGLIGRLDYIQGLGTTSIWLTPSFKNKAVQPEDNSAGYHGYWITDFTQIDPHLGSNEDLRTLIDLAHGRGMKVYFDIITNHTADVIGYEEGNRTPYVSKDQVPYRDAAGQVFDDRDFAGTGAFPELDPASSFPYLPVLEAGEEDLKVPAWLNDVTLYHNRGDTTFTGEDSLYGDFFGLDDLFTEDPRVVDGMKEIYKAWIADFGVDGFRIDTMRHVNDEFWQEFGPEVLEFARARGKDEFLMFGEVFDTSRARTSHFTTGARMQSVLDFPFQDAARNFASRSTPAADLEAFFAADDWYTDADSNVYQLPTFLGNHDMGRIGSFVAADNPGAAGDELLARDRLAHELMYFSRGNPVIYYGDEQGFTGPGGDQDARQSMFASQVEEYLDDDLLGTDATHAQDNFDTGHPLYAKIAELARLTAKHPALRDGAHQNRYASDGPGIYAYSRIDAGEQREYVVAVNNSTEAQSARIPTASPRQKFTALYGSSTRGMRSDRSGNLALEVPPLSAVVLKATAKIPGSRNAPAIRLQQPAVSAEDAGRIEVSAQVRGDSFYQVTFQARTAGGRWQPIGTDDTAPYRVFDDVSDLDAGTRLEYRAVVMDNRRHTAFSRTVAAVVPAAGLSIISPAEGALVSGDVTVTAQAVPEKPSHVVGMERRIGDGPWEQLAADDSSPAYTVVDDLGQLGLAEGARIQYRAVLLSGELRSVSEVRTVVYGTPEVVQPAAVAVAGSLNSELGCPGDWEPACPQAQMVFDGATGLWTLRVTGLPAGRYEFKAALNGSWEENYGAGGVRNGTNVVLEHPGGGVEWTYDHATRIISAS
ncbi:alpha-amylase family glycosyl hydrolase [Arthrobacter sp. 7Tela_A1]|uniref:alpha-amylase family glycosyl hydrolase n=1 Tax=Arthrobacter sp. 7Tela_A1 TaxID=3093745 RepID=UPI003BB64912